MHKEWSFRSPLGLFSKTRKQVSDGQTSTPTPSTSPSLRRSRTLSSGSSFGEGQDFEQMNSSSVVDCRRSPVSDHRRRVFNPEKPSKSKNSDELCVGKGYGSKRTGSSASSNCSTNVSGEVLDRYIDGEQHQETNRPKKNLPRIPTGKESGSRAPRSSFTAPSSPTDSSKSKPKSHSFRETRGSRLHFSSRDSSENEVGHESPRRLARNVIERLSQATVFPTNSSELDHDFPITVEDIYGGSSNNFSTSDLATTQCSTWVDDPSEVVDRYRNKETRSGIHGRTEFLNNNYDPPKSVGLEDQIDLELQRKYREAEERAAILSEELEKKDRFLQDGSFDLPALIHAIRNLAEDRVSLAVEVFESLRYRIADRESSRKELKLAKAELEVQSHRLEKEKMELQYGLEKELDRRSSDWSSKLEKYQSEEQRLRERVRELAEQNVSLQREVASYSEKETESICFIQHSDQQLKDLAAKVKQLSQGNEELQQNLSDVQDKYKAAEENGACIKRNFQEKEKECKDLHKSVARLYRTNSEQEKTIEGLQGTLRENVGKLQSADIIDKRVAEFKMEQVRLTGVELALRKEVESHRAEAENLRSENISLLSRFKGNGKDRGDITFQLEKEMWNGISCLQKQGLSMLNESTNLCSQLVEFIKEKSSRTEESKQDHEVAKSGLDAHFVLESDVKLQGLKVGTESLTRSLQTMSSTLEEKARPPSSGVNGLTHPSGPASEDVLMSELKVEKLMISLLKEKLYSKESEVEQLRAEVATAVRGTDVLKFEVQNALDNLSCALHELKDLGLQVLKKDENMNRLQNELQDSRKELAAMRGILPKITKERDSLWEDLKHYSEQNMLLNAEVAMLKKKIDALEEDILLKEGQITILKDSLGRRPYSILDSPDFS